MKENKLVDLSMDFAIKIIKLCEIIKGHYSLVNQLERYLLQLNRDAEDMFNRLVKQTAECKGVTEQLKATNQIAWVGKMNNIR